MSDTTSERRPIGRLLRTTDYRRLLSAQAVSGVGDWMATVALMALVFDITGSAVAVGGMLAIRLGPGAIAGPLAAQAARRWDRRKTLLAMDLVRAGGGRGDTAGTECRLGAGVGVCPGIGHVDLFARSRCPRPRSRREERSAVGERFGAWCSIRRVAHRRRTVCSVCGRGGRVDRLAPGRPPGSRVPGRCVLTFLGSYLLVRPIRSQTTRIGALDSEVRFRDALSIPIVRSALIPVAAVAAGLGTVFSVGIVFVQDTLGAGDTEFALLIILFGAGALIGLGLIQVAKSDNPFRDVRIGVLSLGVVLALMGLSPSIWATLLGAVGFGAAAVAAIVSAVSGLQLALPEQQRMLAFSAFHIAVRVALGIGAVVAGAVADLLGRIGVNDPVRMVLGGAGLVVAVGVLAVWRRLEISIE